MVDLKGIEKYYDTEEIINRFKELGITAKDTEGNFKSFHDVLNELSEVWDDLSDKEQSPIYEVLLNQESVDIDKCWRKRGCVFNSNFPSYRKCVRINYSVKQCENDNKSEWDIIDSKKYPIEDKF